MSKKLIVNKIEFKKNLLGTVNKVCPKIAYFPLHFYEGSLVSFCSYLTDNCSVWCYVEQKPIATDLEEDTVFYINNPAKLESSISLLPDDRIPLVFTEDQLIIKTDDYRISNKLYNSNLIGNNNNFIEPSKLKKFTGEVKTPITLDSKLVRKITTACNTVSSEKITIETKDGGSTLSIGNSNEDSFRVKIPHAEGFSSKVFFAKDIFRLFAGGEITIGEGSGGNFIQAKEILEDTTRTFLISTIKEK
jgi:hypothetical protein